MLNCIIVDDELKSRESLKIMIEDFCQNAKVCATCQNIDEAIESVQKFKPDVVFLDIQMQRESGFDLLEKLKKVDFEIIFTTAYSEYAIKAFKISAIDYLLKPIDVGELQRAIQKVEKMVSGQLAERFEQMLNNLRPTPNQSHKMALPTSDGLVFVKLSDIIYCEASSNYTFIFTMEPRKHVVSRTLKEYEDLLGDHDFFRIHNSYLINLNAIKKYVRGEGGYVVMNNDASLDVSKRRKEAFLSRLGQGVR